ncbi:MAG TPA: hypothetical protein VJN95_17565 [Gemmatimonadales bacterium]|nr:hypothetical protein [Gemmatimonadales bacterium]
MHRLLGYLVLAAVPFSLSAQSSEFGIRGLGNPYRGASATALGTGGSFASFDGTSSLNPASLGSLTSLTATFTTLTEWRKWEAPTGNASLRDSRFPAFLVAGPVRRAHLVIGAGFSSYADRDYDAFRRDTVVLGGQPVEVFDSIGATGGITDLRGVVAWRPSSEWVIGVSLHLLPGSNRVSVRRTFSDTSFRGVIYKSELSYNAFGADLGVIRRFGSSALIALSVRSDGQTRQQVDSLANVISVDLPYTFSAAALLRPSTRLQIGLQGVYRTWSGANSDLLRLGLPGSRNNLDLSAGFEYRTRPSADQLPLRLGAHYSQMPFALETGQYPDEFGISAGTGARFARGRGALEFALEEIWRSDPVGRKERATILSFQVILRP